MKLRLSILTLIRSPIKTLITFALLVATSFAFVSRGVEFFTTEQVIADAESEYVAVGTLVNTEEKYEEVFEWYPWGFEAIFGENCMDAVQYFCPIDDAAIDLLLSTGYVESSETRHTAGGVTADDVWTFMESAVDGYHFDGLYGHTPMTAVVIATSHTTVGDPSKTTQHYAFFTIDELLIGDPELWPVGEKPRFYIGEDSNQHKYRNHIPGLIINSYDSLYAKLIDGHHYLMVIAPTSSKLMDSLEIVGYDTLQSYTGERDLIPCRLLDLTLLEEEKGAPLVYEDYAHFLEFELFQVMKANFHKQDLIYTRDMSMLPRFHDGTLYIAEGRALTAEDTGNVCVINADFAERNGIAVGDTIDFSVDPNSMVYYGESFAREVLSTYDYALGAEYTDYDLEREQMTYEVVGIWSMPPYEECSQYDDPQSTDPDALRYAYNTVFVPEATYPWTDEVEAHRFPSTFSFRLKHPGDMAKLEYEIGDELLEMGYKLVINDQGYSDIEKSFNAMHTSALVGFIAMAAALLLSLVLIVYLFIIRRKSEYAIMRALGVSAKRASGSLLAGLTVLALAAIVVGSTIALFTSIGYARELAASMASLTGEEANMSLSIWLVPALGAAVLALLLAFAAIGLYTIGKKPPLTLLQGGK